MTDYVFGGPPTSVTEIMEGIRRVEGGWYEATCPRCKWTMDAPTKQELLMPVARHVAGCNPKE